MKSRIPHVFMAVLAVAGLITVFLLQHVDIADKLFNAQHGIARFLINKTVRFFLNDLLALLLIYSLFPQRKFLLFSIWVQVAGFVLFLVPYFILKINHPEYNGPLINFLHRLILNPTLLLLLIPAFYYQKRMER
jgi:exosortase F-associated protein